MALKVLLVIVGLLFIALTYPMILYVGQEPAAAMMFSIYITLGVFLLLAARNPAEHRSLIAFTAWSSFAHAGLMAVQWHHHYIEHAEIYSVTAFIVVGILLLALLPKKESAVESTVAAMSTR